jgi:hypothetical protein
LLHVWGGAILSITAGGKDYTHAPIDASAGGDVTDIVITTTTRSSTVTGGVTNFDAAHGAVVLVFPVDRSLWTDGGFMGSTIGVAPVNSHGQYKVSTQAGEYFIAAVGRRDADRRTDPAFLAALAGKADRLSLILGQTQTRDLKLAEVPQ